MHLLPAVVKTWALTNPIALGEFEARAEERVWTGATADESTHPPAQREFKSLGKFELSANLKYGDQLVTSSPGPALYDEIRAVAVDAVERRRERRRERQRKKHLLPAVVPTESL